MQPVRSGPRCGLGSDGEGQGGHQGPTEHCSPWSRAGGEAVGGMLSLRALGGLTPSLSNAAHR